MKLKRAVIKEELVALTGDYRLAIVLNQMIYWSERVRDFDKFIEEEKKRILSYAQSEKDAQRVEALKLTRGWIYKKAEDLAEETMMNVSKTTMGKYLDKLVEKGWLEKRRNPHLPLDKTYQYRVNISKIQRDLLALGYNLEGYKIDLTKLKVKPEPEDDPEDKTFEDEPSKDETSKSNNLTSKSENLTRDQENGLEIKKMDSKSKNETAIPETTHTETTCLETTNVEITNHHHHHNADQETDQKVVVVSEKDIQFVQAHIKYLFNVELDKDQIIRLIRICIQNGKEVAQVVESTYYHFLEKREPIKDLMSALIYGAKNGWELSKQVKVTPTLFDGSSMGSKTEYRPYNWVNPTE